MRDLKVEPAWESKDLGLPLPDSPHACSVCLPTWDSVVGYEEARDKVLRKLRSGYPRFFTYPSVKALNEEAERLIGHPGERVVVFPSREVAQRVQRFVEKNLGSASRIASFEGLQALAFPEDALETVMSYWRFSGEILSSRAAEDILEHREAGELGSLHSFLAELFACDSEHLFLYETGMAALFSLHQVITRMFSGRKTLQLDFPYVDTLKVQESFGSGVVFLPECRGENLEEALDRLRKGEFAAAFCELPSNPLLYSVNLEQVSDAARAGRVPLFIDDTVCTHLNVDVMPYADVVSTSLTKWISGKGNVMGGALLINPDSPHFAGIYAGLLESNPTMSRVYPADSRILRSNAEGFFERMSQVNRNGEMLAEYLEEHPAVAKVWYPKLVSKENYDLVRTKEGGYGGLVSFRLRNEKRASKVYDALAWNKGPSLGTEFSLACPYTLLAHYDEIEWAEGCGVSANLIRLSAGVEDPEFLLGALAKALENA